MNSFELFFIDLYSVTNRGASKTRAEIIPSEPDSDNAGVGKEYYNPLGFLLLILINKRLTGIYPLVLIKSKELCKEIILSF